jgi:hypothetical protein
VRSPAARPLCCGSLGPGQPRWLAFTQARLAAQVEGCSRWAPSHGTGGGAANQSRAPG